MAKFINDKEIEKDKIIDLGEIGKFKRSFLEEAIKLDPSPVKQTARTRIEIINHEINEIGTTKIGLFSNIEEIYKYTQRYNKLIERRNKLKNDMSKYYYEFPDRRYK